MNKESTMTAEEIAENSRLRREEIEKEKMAAAEEERNRIKEGLAAMAQGKGKLLLQTPIRAAGRDLTELAYDFLSITGREYADAMDKVQGTGNVYSISYGQSLKLFAVAAAKNTPEVDEKDIMERIGIADSIAAIQLSTFFFNASTRAGRKCISKM